MCLLLQASLAAPLSYGITAALLGMHMLRLANNRLFVARTSGALAKAVLLPQKLWVWPQLGDTVLDTEVMCTVCAGHHTEIKCTVCGPPVVRSLGAKLLSQILLEYMGQHVTCFGLLGARC